MLARMTTFSHTDYLDHLRTESRRFRTVLAECDPAARVPGCPAWDASDLLWHLAEVQWFWATTIRSRPDAPRGEDAGPDRPGTYDGLLAAYDEYSAGLLAELGKADPAEPAWSWSDEQTVGFTVRRQAHEALIHRLDAEQTAGALTPLDPDLAADGVLECLDIMFGRTPPWAEFRPLPHYVRVECTDTGDRIWVQIGRSVGTNPKDDTRHDDHDISVVPDPGVEADTVVEGPAAAVDAWLWRRGDDAEITIHGDRHIYDHFRAAVNHPIN